MTTTVHEVKVWCLNTICHPKPTRVANVRLRRRPEDCSTVPGGPNECRVWPCVRHAPDEPRWIIISLQVPRALRSAEKWTAPRWAILCTIGGSHGERAELTDDTAARVFGKFADTGTERVSLHDLAAKVVGTFGER